MGGQQIDDVHVAVERTVFTGMNARDYAGTLGETVVSTARNVDMSRLGVLSGIRGYSAQGANMGTGGICVLKRFQKAGGSDLLIAGEGPNLRSWNGGGDWSAPFYTGITPGSAPLLVVGNGVLLISDGLTNVRSYDQTAVSDLGNANSSPPRARVGAYVNNRFVLANTITQPDYFWFSDVLSTTFDRATNVFKLNSGTGAPINGIVDMGNGEVVFLKEDEIHTVYISDADPGNWYAIKNTDDDGSASPRANVRVGNDIFYLSRKKKGITSIGKNEYDKTVGRSVAVSDSVYTGVMENINWAFAHLACATVYENMMIFAVPVKPSTVPNVWVILFLHDDQSLNGWAVRPEPGTLCFETYPVAGENMLFFGSPLRGTVMKAFSGYLDDGAATARVLEGRQEDFSEASAKYNAKIGEFVDLTFLTDSEGGPVDVFFQRDESDYTLLGSVDTAGTVTALPAALPAVLGEQGKITRRFALDPFDQWGKCRLKLVQEAAEKTFHFLGYLIMARKQPVT